MSDEELVTFLREVTMDGTSRLYLIDDESKRRLLALAEECLRRRKEAGHE